MLSEVTMVGQIAVKASIGVLLGSLGEIVTEKSGVLNLGVEGMMLFGAMAGFAVGSITGNAYLAASAGMVGGGLLGLLHAVFSISLQANQVLSGLAITIFGSGLAHFLGRPFINARGVTLAPLPIPLLSDIPVLGKVFFSQSILAYTAYALTLILYFMLTKSRTGLVIRAAGEDAAAADAAGTPVTTIRYASTVFGGMLAGLGGAYLSLVHTPGWKEHMTGGQGWIAIAMVLFSVWNPLWAFCGALLFGVLTALQFAFQMWGVTAVPQYILKMMPYLLTIMVMAVIHLSPSLRRKSGAPGDLGRPFSREG
ncbi:MAG: ABC transporter permease [Desulfovibrio sp.]|nr:MAG: ABC transporter permease [Desulfovibrio sp.]